MSACPAAGGINCVVGFYRMILPLSNAVAELEQAVEVRVDSTAA